MYEKNVNFVLKNMKLKKNVKISILGVMKGL